MLNLQNTFFWINGVASHCTRSCAVIAYYQCKIESNWVTRSVHRSEESLIEYREENDKLANTVTMTERDTCVRNVLMERAE